MDQQMQPNVCHHIRRIPLRTWSRTAMEALVQAKILQAGRTSTRRQCHPPVRSATARAILPGTMSQCQFPWRDWRGVPLGLWCARRRVQPVMGTGLFEYSAKPGLNQRYASLMMLCGMEGDFPEIGWRPYCWCTT